MLVKNSSDITTKSLKLKAAVYGKSGTGKTTFGSTFPSPLFLDLDRGMLSVRGTKARYIELARPQDKRTGNTLYNQWWKEIMEAAQFAIKDEECESIIIDSMTWIGEACIGSIVGMRKPGFDDWTAHYNKLRDFVFLIKESGKNCLFICHDQIEKDELAGKVWMFPMIQGQMRQKFGDLFDEFYYSDVVETGGKQEYRLLCRSTTIFTAKSRLLRKEDPKKHLPPSYDEIIKRAK